VFLHLPRLIEGEVEEASLVAPHAESLDARDGLGFADRTLELLYHRDVNLAALLGGEEAFDLLQASLEVAPGDTETILAPADEVEIAPHLVIEDGDIPRGLIRDDDVVAVLMQL